jgi:hypothetical protein
MTATNHALTGTAIGLIVGQPWLALPLALLSHYVCDALPHFGLTEDESKKKKLLNSNLFRNYLIAEAVICGLIVLGLAILRPINWQLAAICAFVAAAPDLLSANRYFSAVRKKPWKPGWYSRFAHNIQWFEKPIGAVVEVAWLTAALVVISPFLT